MYTQITPNDCDKVTEAEADLQTVLLVAVAIRRPAILSVLLWWHVVVLFASQQQTVANRGMPVPRLPSHGLESLRDSGVVDDVVVGEREFIAAKRGSRIDTGTDFATCILIRARRHVFVRDTGRQIRDVWCGEF